MNQEIMDGIAGKFNPPYDDIFQCVYRARGRGEGIMLNKERMRDIENALYSEQRKIKDQCRIRSLRDIGVSDYDFWYQYEDDNPDGLSMDELENMRNKHYENEGACNREERLKVNKKRKSDLICLQTGEEIG